MQHKQLLIPGFPDGAQRIGEAVSIVEKDGWVTYFVGGDDYWPYLGNFWTIRADLFAVNWPDWG